MGIAEKEGGLLVFDTDILREKKLAEITAQSPG